MARKPMQPQVTQWQLNSVIPRGQLETVMEAVYLAGGKPADLIPLIPLPAPTTNGESTIAGLLPPPRRDALSVVMEAAKAAGGKITFVQACDAAEAAQFTRKGTGSTLNTAVKRKLLKRVAQGVYEVVGTKTNGTQNGGHTVPEKIKGIIERALPGTITIDEIRAEMKKQHLTPASASSTLTLLLQAKAIKRAGRGVYQGKGGHHGA